MLYIILSILAIILLVIIYKKFGINYSIVFLLGMFICDYFYMGLSLQGAPVFIISMIASVIFLSHKIQDKNLIFLIVGGLTSFFDFL